MKTLRLLDLPLKSKIYCELSDGSMYFIYDHPDGMYSYCVSEKGGTLHIGLAAQFEPFKDGYKLLETGTE